jgi:hypothetical protein
VIAENVTRTARPKPTAVLYPPDRIARSIKELLVCSTTSSPHPE